MKQEHPMTPGVLVPRVPGGAHPLYERGAITNAARQAVPSDRQTLLYLMQQFSSEEWNCPQCGHSESTADMDSAIHLREHLATTPQAERKTCLVGMRGKAYDTPEIKRAYTYKEQPNNLDAHRLGEAARVAIAANAGDSIDRGLALLKALEYVGFGVFELGAEHTETERIAEHSGVTGALMIALEHLTHDPRVPNEVAQDLAPVLIQCRRFIAEAPPTPNVPGLVGDLARNLRLLNARPRPQCRDCADRDGVCDNGLDCDMTALLARADQLVATHEREASRATDKARQGKEGEE